MVIIQRSFVDEADLSAMAKLANEFASENMHVADLPYRFSSWAMDYPENIGLWFDGNENIVGWAVMQTPFWTIDYAVHPRVIGNVHSQILGWVDERAKQIVDLNSGRPIWFINAFARQENRLQDLEEAGFASQADVGENSWTKVLMKLENQSAMEKPVLPDGFIVRSLAGDDEVDAYVEMHREIFESKNMTQEWRRRTLKRPEYVPELDLVAVAPDGQLAGFCIGWLNKQPTSGMSGQVEPLGVRKAYRKLGLGRCLLLEGLSRLQECGAKAMYVETDNYRDEAFMLYESVGYQVLEDVLVYRKDYAPL
jgi:ribosomal protein S18 acetylase RimI-like enzyme